MANKDGIALESISGFPADIIERLVGLWINTAEELVSAASQENGLAGLVTYLNLPEAEVTRLVDLALAALPPNLSFDTGDIETHGLGALDEPEEGFEQGGPVSFAPLPDSVNLFPHFGPVRDQGQRGTCVAHACAAVREFLIGQDSTQSNLSEQFLYWDCKKHDLAPGSGTFIRVGMNRLEVDGIPKEAEWPYNPNPIDGNEGQDPPPAGIIQKANPFRTISSTSLPPTNVDSIRQALAESKPVAFSVPVYTHWFREPTRTTGDIRMPLPGEKVEGGHAMCIVGYEVDPTVPGGGYFMVRNSWGINWARSSTLAAGYARIPFSYINQYGKSAYTAAVGSVVEPKSFWRPLRNWIRGLFGG